MLPGTAGAWIEAITHGRKFERERDEQRVREAFVILSSIIRRWPSPAEFLEAMPRPVAQLALTKQHIPADPERAAAAIAQVQELLNPRAGKVAASGPDA